MGRPGVRDLPLVTYMLLLLNGIAFIYELSLGEDLAALLYRWGAVSHEILDYLRGDQSSPAVLVTLLSSLFLHVGWVHLAANMLYLWFFGERVERALGSRLFAGLYLGAGLLAGIGQLLATPGAQVPAVGASGAVAGVIGAYVALQPGSTAAALAPGMFYRRGAELPAAVMLALWLLAQALVGTLAITELAYFPAVGWWAHLAGLGAGVCFGSAVAYQRRASAWGHHGPSGAIRAYGREIDGVEEARHQWRSR